MSLAAHRVRARPYLFEVVVLANFLLIWAMASSQGFRVVGTIPIEFHHSGTLLIYQVIGGIAVRLIWEALRGRGRTYWQVIATAGWLTDTLRLVVFGFLLTHTYGWIKLTVPVFHPRLFDHELGQIGRWIFAGHSPAIFVLTALSNPIVLKFFDQAYAAVFFLTLVVATMFFLSHPSRRVRAAFMTGNAFLWIGGAWLYMLIPSLGPAYVFPDVWLQYRQSLPVTQHFQSLLMQNYRNMIRLKGDINSPITIAFGIAAFPSLHVAFQTYVLLWMRRVWKYGGAIWLLFLALIFTGSMATGWHHFIDGVGGALLALLAYAIAFRIYRLGDWFRLCALTRR